MRICIIILIMAMFFWFFLDNHPCVTCCSSMESWRGRARHLIWIPHCNLIHLALSLHSLSHSAAFYFLLPFYLLYIHTHTHLHLLHLSFLHCWLGWTACHRSVVIDCSGWKVSVTFFFFTFKWARICTSPCFCAWVSTHTTSHCAF